MKIYKCRVRITEVREGVEFMAAPTEEIAKNSNWLTWAEQTTYLEEIEHVNKNCEVLSVEPVTLLGQVPENWHDSLPWYDPKYSPKEELAIKDLLPNEFADQKSDIQYEIQLLKKQKDGINSQIAKLKSFL